MRKSKADFMELIASGEYYVVQKIHDRNRDDLTLRREDGLPAEIHNFPYRINQMPTYIFHEFLSEGVIKQDGTDELGGTIFRPAKKRNGRPREPLERHHFSNPLPRPCTVSAITGPRLARVCCLSGLKRANEVEIAPQNRVEPAGAPSCRHVADEGRRAIAIAPDEGVRSARCARAAARVTRSLFGGKSPSGAAATRTRAVTRSTVLSSLAVSKTCRPVSRSRARCAPKPLMRRIGDSLARPGTSESCMLRAAAQLRYMSSNCLHQACASVLSAPPSRAGSTVSAASTGAASNTSLMPSPMNEAAAQDARSAPSRTCRHAPAPWQDAREKPPPCSRQPEPGPSARCAPAPRIARHPSRSPGSAFSPLVAIFAPPIPLIHRGEDRLVRFLKGLHLGCGAGRRKDHGGQRDALAGV